MYKSKKIVEALTFIASKFQTIDKLKLIKLLYLSDRLHLMKYGRTITSDSVYALPHGPICSYSLDVLKGSEAKTEFSKYFKRLSSDLFSVNKKNLELECLSESDKEIIGDIIKKFGAKTGSQLRNYTHTLPEWKRFEAHFEVSRSRKEIVVSDLFSNLPSCDLKISESHLKTSKNIYFGE